MRLAHASATLLMAGSLTLSAWANPHLPPYLVQPMPAAAQAVDPALSRAAVRKAEIDIEIAWLADPAVFPCQLSVHCRGPIIELSGMVPDEPTRMRAIALAQKESHLPVEDRLIVQAGSALPVLPCNRDALCRTAITRLARHLGHNGLPWEVSADATGQIIVTGSIPSCEEKLEVSRRMSQLPGCSAVANHLVVKPFLKDGRTYSPVTTDQDLLMPNRPLAASVSTKPAPQNDATSQGLPLPVFRRPVDDDSPSPYAQAANQPKPLPASAETSKQPAKTSQWAAVSAPAAAPRQAAPAATSQWMPAAPAQVAMQPTNRPATPPPASQWTPVASQRPAVKLSAPVAPTAPKQPPVDAIASPYARNGWGPPPAAAPVAAARPKESAKPQEMKPATMAAAPKALPETKPAPAAPQAMVAEAPKALPDAKPATPAPPSMVAGVATRPSASNASTPPASAGTPSSQRSASPAATAGTPSTGPRTPQASSGGLLARAMRTFVPNRAEVKQPAAPAPSRPAAPPVVAASLQQPASAKPTVVPVSHQADIDGYQPMPRGPEQPLSPASAPQRPPQTSPVPTTPRMPPAAKPTDNSTASPYATRRVEDRPAQPSNVQPAAAMQPAPMPPRVAPPPPRPLPPQATTPRQPQMSNLTPAVAVRQQPAELTPAFLNQLQGRIQQVCNGRVRDIQIKRIAKDRLEISMKVANAEEGQRYASMILALSELVPFQVDLAMTLDK